MIPPWHAASVMKISPKEAFSVWHHCQRRPKFGTRDRLYQAQVVLSTPDFEGKPNTSTAHVHQCPEDGYRLKHTNMADGAPWLPVLRRCYQVGIDRVPQGTQITGGKNVVLGRPAS